MYHEHLFHWLCQLGRTLNNIRTTSYIAILHNYMISLKILSKNWANMSDLCSFCVIRLKCSICDFKTKPSYSSVEWCTSCGYGCIIALFPINLFFNGFHRAAFVIAGKSHVFRSLSKSCKKKMWMCPWESLWSLAHGFHPAALAETTTHEMLFPLRKASQIKSNSQRCVVCTSQLCLRFSLSLSLFPFFWVFFLHAPPSFLSEHNVMRSALTPWQFCIFSKSCEDAERRWSCAVASAQDLPTVGFIFTGIFF